MAAYRQRLSAMLAQQFRRVNVETPAGRQHLLSSYWAGMSRFLPGASHPKLAKAGLGRKSPSWREDDMKRRRAEFARDMERALNEKLEAWNYLDPVGDRGGRSAWHRRRGAGDSPCPGDAQPQGGGGHFNVSLDLRDFRPGEISVRLVAGRRVRVEANRRELDGEAEGGGGGVRRTLEQSYQRDFSLPARVEPADLTARLDADGTLHLTAVSREVGAERRVPIHVEKGDGPASAEEMARAVEETSENEADPAGRKQS